METTFPTEFTNTYYKVDGHIGKVAESVYSDVENLMPSIKDIHGGTVQVHSYVDGDCQTELLEIVMTDFYNITERTINDIIKSSSIIKRFYDRMFDDTYKEYFKKVITNSPRLPNGMSLIKHTEGSMLIVQYSNDVLSIMLPGHGVITAIEKAIKKNDRKYNGGIISAIKNILSDDFDIAEDPITVSKAIRLLSGMGYTEHMRIAVGNIKYASFQDTGILRKDVTTLSAMYKSWVQSIIAGMDIINFPSTSKHCTMLLESYGDVCTTRNHQLLVNRKMAIIKTDKGAYIFILVGPYGTLEFVLMPTELVYILNGVSSIVLT